jgi:hypothetical protein
MRDGKLFVTRAATWDEFCLKYLGLSSRHANRIVRHLEEFGPSYFELAQLTRISPAQFRAIAPAVRDQRIHAHGEAIALIPENSVQIAAAVADLRRDAPPKTPTKNDRASAVDRGSKGDRRCQVDRHFQQVLSEIRELVAAKPDGVDKLLLRSTIQEAIAALRGMDLEMGI